MQPDLRRLSKDYAHRRARFTLSFYPPNFSPNNCVRERPAQSEAVSLPSLKHFNELQKWDVLRHYDYQLGQFVNTS